MDLVFRPEKRMFPQGNAIFLFLVGILFTAIGVWMLSVGVGVASLPPGDVNVLGVSVSDPGAQRVTWFLMGLVFAVPGAMVMLAGGTSGKISYHVTDDGLLITAPMSKRLIRYEDIVKVEEVDEEQAKEIVADAYLEFEKYKAGLSAAGPMGFDLIMRVNDSYSHFLETFNPWKYSGRQIAFSTNARESGMSLSIGPFAFSRARYIPATRVDVYGLKGNFVLLTIKQENKEPTKFLFGPSDTQGFIKAIKERIKR